MHPRFRWLWLCLGLLGSVLGGVLPVRAQTAVEHMPLVQVALWPEYDRPAMLVMYIIHLPQDVTLPTEVVVRIPARVRAPSAVAVRTPEGRLLNTPYRTEADPTSDQWRLVVVEATEPLLHIEFYDALEMDGARRQYRYEWPAHWSVDELTVEVQYPAASQGMQITPEPAAVETRDGLQYATIQFGAVEVGQTVTVEVAYENPSGNLSHPPTSPPDDIPTATAKDRNQAKWTMYLVPGVLAGIGVVLLILAFWMYRHGPKVPNVYDHDAPRRVTRPAQKPGAADEIRYCPQCGTRARPGDRFCRMCGTPLR